MSPAALTRLTRRADFQLANRGGRVTTAGFVLLVRTRGDGAGLKRVGFTVTRKIGGAVVRNRLKRRLREVAREVLPAEGLAGADHVFIGRSAGLTRPYAALTQDLRQALRRLRA